MVFSYVIKIDLPLPDAKQFGKEAYDMAFPQILAFCSAVAGILLVNLLIKAFSKGG